MEGTKYILSIDGGGIRGIIPATIISEFEKRVTEIIKKENPDKPDIDIKCSDLFDIIAGTSTGSILALALSVGKNNRPKYSGDFMVKFYHEHGYDVFPDHSAFKFIDHLMNSSDKLLHAFHIRATVSNVIHNVTDCIHNIETKFAHDNTENPVDNTENSVDNIETSVDNTEKP
ncbi:164_t:CDS:1, partial [Scutellospora calospora]